MKIKNYFFYTSLSLLLYVPTNAFSSIGADININNQTPYPFTKITETRDSNVKELTSPSLIESGMVNTLYVEFATLQKSSSPVPTATVTYGVTCPNGQVDKFRIKIRYDLIAHGTIHLSAVDHDTHCVSFFGNDDLVWRDNYYNTPAPTIVINTK